MIDAVFDAGDIDLVLLAFGVLGDQADFDAHPERAVEAAAVNYVGAVSAGLVVADRFRHQGHGTLVVLSSVAGERARRTNFVYGSTKAGLDAFAQGLGDSLVGTRGPGDGRAARLRPHPDDRRAWTPSRCRPRPEVVAEQVVRGLERGSDIVWAPPPLRWVFAVLRHLPRPLWRVVSAR